jgi:hypothetical protein
MLALLAAVVMILAAGLPTGYVVLRDLRLALLVAPLITALSAAVSVMLMLIVGGRLLWWLGPLLLVQWAVAPVLLRRTAGAARPPHRSWADVLWLTVPLLPPFLLVIAPPVQWDANSIWFLHAAYFTHGAPLAREYLGLPSIDFSHPDYPPLASSTIGAVWGVLPGYKLYVAQIVSATLNFSAIAMLGYAVRVVTGRAPTMVSRLAAAGVALAAWGEAPFVVAGGLSDALWATAFVGAALLLLLRPDPLRRPVLALLLLGVAALTKNEGLIMAVALALIATVRLWRQLRRAAILWLPVAGGVVWSVLARHFGAKSDVTSDSNIGGLLRLDPTVYHKLRPTLTAIWTQVGPMVAVSVAVAVLGGIFLRRQRRAQGLGSDLWLWLVFLAYLFFLTLTYVTSTSNLAWYLGTSAFRVALPFALLAAASAVCWAAVAASGGRARGKRPLPPWSEPGPGATGEGPAGSSTPAAEAAGPDSGTDEWPGGRAEPGTRGVQEAVPGLR